jgi:chromosome segregation ATPase
MGDNDKTPKGGNTDQSSTPGVNTSTSFDITAEGKELRDAIDKFRDATGDLEGAITKAKRELKELRDRKIKDEAKIKDLETEILGLTARLRIATSAMDTFATNGPTAPPPTDNSASLQAAVDRLNTSIVSLQTAPNPLQQEVDRLNALVVSLQNGQSVYSRVSSQDVAKIKNDTHRSFWHNTFVGIYNRNFPGRRTMDDSDKIIEKMVTAVRSSIDDSLL